MYMYIYIYIYIYIYYVDVHIYIYIVMYMCMYMYPYLSIYLFYVLSIFIDMFGFACFFAAGGGGGGVIFPSPGFRMFRGLFQKQRFTVLRVVLVIEKAGMRWGGAALTC